MKGDEDIFSRKMKKGTSMKKEQLEYAAARYGTPLYIFNMDILKKQAERLKQALGEETGLCYAMKANPFLTKEMAEYVDRIEVCSMGEFEICRRMEIPQEKLFISGVLKKKEDIYHILDTFGEKCRYTVESVKQLHYFLEWSDAHMKVLRLYPRLTNGSQFGMDEETVRSVISIANMSPYLEIEGIHYFSGTQKRRTRQFQQELEMLDRFLRKMREEWKVQIRHLEYGPGTAVPYFRGKEARTYTDEGLATLREAISSMQWKGNVTIEMGRAFAAECGYYLTEIKDVKKNGDINYCIVDGGNHQLNYDGQIKGMYQPEIQLIPGDQRGSRKLWTVCGALCTMNDVLCSNVELSDVRTGRVLVFERTGAYSSMEGMALFLSHALPAVVSYGREQGWNVLRQNKPTYLWNMPEKTVEYTEKIN